MSRHGVAELDRLVLAQPAPQAVLIIGDDAGTEARARCEVGQVRRTVAVADAGNAMALAAAFLEHFARGAGSGLAYLETLSRGGPVIEPVGGHRLHVQLHMGVLQTAKLGALAVK